jgi:hypothetical protein
MAIKRGDAVIITDAFGKEHQAEAMTPIQGTHSGTGFRVHDFPVIYVQTVRMTEPVPWPVEDVRLARVDEGRGADSDG